MDYDYGWNCDGGLHQAARENDIELAGFLLKRGGVNVDDEGYDSWTPLHCAARHGNIEVAKMLIAAGADIDSLSDDDSTPLHHAVAGGDADTICYLLGAGADGKVENAMGETPFECMWESAHLSKVVKQQVGDV